MSRSNRKEENRLLEVEPASARNLSSLAVKRKDDNPPQPTDPDNIMTAEDLARYLHVHRSTIYRLLKGGQIPG